MKTQRRHFLTAAGATAVATWCVPWVRATPSGRLHAGAAVANITPEMGVSLKGPIGSNGIVKKVHDPLHARCLALDDGTTRLAICVCDVTAIWEQSLERAKRLVHERIGLPIDRMLISATHSHAAPRICGVSDAEIDTKYYDAVERRIADAICRAVANLAPAAVGWGVASKPEFVKLRNSRIEPGSNGPNPFGELTDRAWMYARPSTIIKAEGREDPFLSVLSVRHADGRPLAVLGNYSIHYVGGFERNTVSADYFACFAAEIQTLLGADRAAQPFVGILSNGNSGNISPYHGGYEGMRQVGHSLAAEAFRLCGSVRHQERVTLAMCEERLELGVRLPDAQRIQWAHDVQAGKFKRPAHAHRDTYAQQTLLLAGYPVTVAPKFQALRIGELGIAANPTEMYAETGLEIRERSPLQPTFNIQLANGYCGYLPPSEQHALGGYSTWPATSSYLEVDAAGKIREHLLKLLTQVGRL